MPIKDNEIICSVKQPTDNFKTMKKELPQTFDSASSRKHWKATAYYTGGFVQPPNFFAEIKDKLIKKIKELRRKQ
jgi:hypothetical protein